MFAVGVVDAFGLGVAVFFAWTVVLAVGLGIKLSEATIDGFGDGLFLGLFFEYPNRVKLARAIINKITIGANPFLDIN